MKYITTVYFYFLPYFIHLFSFNTYLPFQAVFFILVRPLSKNMYRRINKVVAELLWLELIWLIDWWAGVKVMNFFLRTVYTFCLFICIFFLNFSPCILDAYLVHIKDLFFEIVISFGIRYGSKIVVIK